MPFPVAGLRVYYNNNNDNIIQSKNRPYHLWLGREVQIVNGVVQNRKQESSHGVQISGAILLIVLLIYLLLQPILVLYPSTPLFPISHPPIEDISEWIMSPLNHINFDGPEDNIRSRKYASKGKAGCGNDEVASIYQKGKGERPGKSPTINQKSGSYFAFCYCRYFFCSSSQTNTRQHQFHTWILWSLNRDQGRRQNYLPLLANSRSSIICIKLDTQHRNTHKDCSNGCESRGRVPPEGIYRGTTW